MHIVQHPVRQRVQRRMYSPIERGVVSNVRVGNGMRYDYSGLGELDGSILQNISRIVGGAVTTVATGGLIWLAPKKFRASAERITGAFVTSGGIGASIAPKAFGLSKSEGNIVRGITAGVAVVGGGIMLAPMMAGGTALTSVGATGIGTAASGSSTIGAALGTSGTASGGLLSTIGSGLSSVGSGILSVGKAILPTALTTMVGGGGGGQQVQQQQGGMTQAEYDAYMRQQAQAQAEYDRQQQQAAYDRQVALAQSQMYDPGAMYTQVGQPGAMQTAYGDLRSPYTAVTEDGETVQVDPTTGQIIQASMSTPMLVGIGAIALLAGWYLMSGSKANN